MRIVVKWKQKPNVAALVAGNNSEEYSAKTEVTSKSVMLDELKIRH
jgi:hypothetical protein